MERIILSNENIGNCARSVPRIPKNFGTTIIRVDSSTLASDHMDSMSGALYFVVLPAWVNTYHQAVTMRKGQRAEVFKLMHGTEAWSRWGDAHTRQSEMDMVQDSGKREYCSSELKLKLDHLPSTKFEEIGENK